MSYQHHYAVPALLEGFGGFVPGGGPPDAEVAGVGEAPGRNEDRIRKCFVGEAGRELDEYLAKFAGLDRHNVYITNVVKQRPPDNRTPKPWEVAHWSPYLEAELRTVHPKLILAFGATATHWFLGEDANMEVLHGRPQISRRLGYDVPVIPTLHPAAGIHDFNAVPLIIRDFRAIRAYRHGELILPEPGHYESRRIYDSYEAVYELIRNSTSRYIGLDTEGTWANPICLSFSVDGVHGYIVMVDEKQALRALHDAIREFKVRVGLHNAPHDLKVLAKMGITIPDEQIDDTMVGSFVLCLNPIGLKALSYRRFGLKMRDYQDLVWPYTREKALAYLTKVAALDFWRDVHPVGKKGQPLKRTVPELMPYDERLALANLILYDGDAAGASLRRLEDYCRYVEDSGYAGRHQVVEKKALKVRLKTVQPVHKKAANILKTYADKPETNIVDRWRKIPEVERQLVEDLLDPIPVATLRDVPEADFVDYAGLDAIATHRHCEFQEPLVRDMPAYHMDVAVLPMISRMETVGMYVNREKMTVLDEEWERQLYRLEYQIQGLVGEDWFSNFQTALNLCSRDQVADLLFKVLDLTPSGRMTKGKKRHVVDGAVLEALAHDHTAVPLIKDFAELAKLRGTYTQGILKILPDDNRLHPNLRFTTIPSGRFACVEPNLLAIPTRTSNGRLIRECFEAYKGHVLGTVDLSTIEMRVAAHMSRDPVMVQFMNLAVDPETGKKPDLHMYTASQILGRPQSTIEKWERTIFKTIGFGILYQITEQGLIDALKGFGVTEIKGVCAQCSGHGYNAGRDTCPVCGGTGKVGKPITIEDCTKYIEEWFKVFKGVRQWVEDTKRFIHEKGYVEDMWGRRRYGEAVWSTIERVRDSCYRALVNHVVQAGAQGVMKMAMVNLWRNQWDTLRAYGYCEPLLQVHDELLVECEARYWDVIADIIEFEMQNAVKLIVPIETNRASAENWGALEK